MTRPCFLVVDREHPGSISTRKLVIETAKLNVITAYSGAEATEMLDRFPSVDGVVLDAGIRDVSCKELLGVLKTRHPGVPLILVGTPMSPSCEGADHFMEAFEPGKLLELLRRLVPEADRVMEREMAEAPTER